jgi:Flp pilus assembly pilin Flp
MLALFTSMLGSDEGASMVEYGLILALVALVALTAVEGLGTGVGSLFQSAASYM